jgi:hypothetical protein
MSQPRWPLLVAEPMTFVVEPPSEIGEVVGAWTNNGPGGIKPTPISLRLMWLLLGALAGLALGLIGFFVIGGILEKRGGSNGASWFLPGLGGGALVGVLAMLPLALRKPRILTLFVGKDGCAQMTGGKVHLLAFRDVQAIRAKVSVVTYQGIRTSARELHVRDGRGKERLWYVSAATEKPDDAQYQFGEAVVRAFEAQRR